MHWVLILTRRIVVPTFFAFALTTPVHWWGSRVLRGTLKVHGYLLSSLVSVCQKLHGQVDVVKSNQLGQLSGDLIIRPRRRKEGM